MFRRQTTPQIDHHATERQNQDHTLFIEGGSQVTGDAQLLWYLFEDRGVHIKIKPMGPAYNLRNVAKALHPHHRNYYFLIDRDHQDDETVLRTWERFPDPESANLLIWKKKEFENYFLDPDYLVLSDHLREEFNRDQLAELILKEASQRLFLDVANQVIIALREEQKCNWITIYTENRTEFSNANTAKAYLLNNPAIKRRRENIPPMLTEEIISKKFDDYLKDFTGGESTLRFDKGAWFNRVSGKPILNTIINQAFRVVDRSGSFLQGEQRYYEVIRNLLKHPLDKQPEDFQELFERIQRRAKNRYISPPLD
ncbi:hypothetical protein ACQZV8_01170 [Magnetococcales bacterium HHB-1]